MFDRDVPADDGLPVRDGGNAETADDGLPVRDGGNAETERCFSCQNHRDVLVDGRLSVRDGGNPETERCFSCQNHRDGALLQLPEPQRCTG